MAETVTIARPYAEAVFRLAQEQNALAAWSERLSALSAVTADSQVQECIGNPGVSAAQKTDLVSALLKGEGQGDVANLIQVLAKNERLTLLPAIAELFETLKGQAEGVKDATILSAYPMEQAQVSALVAELESRFASRLKAEVVVDASLIGGVKIVVGDQVLDASVRGKLDAMATALKN